LRRYIRIAALPAAWRGGLRRPEVRRRENGYVRRIMHDFGLLVSRLALGSGIAAHGAQKAFGAFDGPGPQGAAQFLQSLGFIPGEQYATAAAWTELAGGTMIALGVGGPLGPAALISTMVVAQTSVHAKNGFFAQKNGVELGVVYSAGALALASSGFGRFSLDEALGLAKLREGWLTTLAVAGGVAAALLILAQRNEAEFVQPPAAAHAQPAPGAQDDAAAEQFIAAASEDRPVPADLLAAADGNSAPQV
jgi:putative oxidoreductase